jgi:excisionase family DNA binding protein
VNEQEERPRLLLTLDEVAQQLSISREAVYRLVFSGDLISLKLGSLRRVSRPALLAFLARKEREATP